MSEKYSVADCTVEQILNFIKSNEIAIPELKRPCVWKENHDRRTAACYCSLLIVLLDICKVWFLAHEEKIRRDNRQRFFNCWEIH